jgi:hypothetical protein
MYKAGCWSKIAAIAICLALCSGCAPALRVVEGRVTLDGNPLASGAIDFEPADTHRGKPFGGDIKDGSYRIEIPREGAVGKYVVRITSMRSTGRKVLAGPPAARGATIDEVAEAMPAQYNTKSTLQVDLSRVGPFDFQLSSSQAK